MSTAVTICLPPFQFGCHLFLFLALLPWVDKLVFILQRKGATSERVNSLPDAEQLACGCPTLPRALSFPSPFAKVCNTNGKWVIKQRPAAMTILSTPQRFTQTHSASVCTWQKRFSQVHGKKNCATKKLFMDFEFFGGESETLQFSLNSIFAVKLWKHLCLQKHMHPLEAIAVSYLKTYSVFQVWITHLS